MKLKKLDITGFKSFCEKSTIHFSPGICAIVGPNGCGKSNVVDALRWVMGEQSVKQLRGKTREDIIFAGASGKPALGMAEVSLTLSNDTGDMPEAFRDFAEVMVTRRLYRNGDSAYLVNRNPCRLKDIHDIFLAAGAGSRSYAVIQQGNIGAITDAGPDERRTFIEEAAGVTRYKMRKTEALSKIEATNQNLLRVEDIIKEIDRQMAGLKRQARKAEQFKTLKDEARNIDVRLIRLKNGALCQKMQEISRTRDTLRDAELHEIEALRHIGAAVEAIERQQFSQKKDMADRKSRQITLQREIDRAENDLSHLKTDDERRAGEIVSLKTARALMVTEIERMKGEMDAATQDHLSLTQTVETLRAAISRENADSASLHTTLDQLNQDMEAGKNELMRLVAEEARIKTAFQSAADALAALKRRLARTAEEMALSEKAVQDTAHHKDRADAEFQQIKDEIAEWDAQAAALEQKGEGISAKLSEKDALLRQLEMDRHAAASRLDALRQMEAGYEGYREGVKAVLNASEKPDPQTGKPVLDGILGILADGITPEPGWEIAVEAALGDALQYVRVRDSQSGRKALEFLKTTTAGRCGFIPVDTVRPVCVMPDVSVETDNSLLCHLQIKPGYEAAVRALLGSTQTADTVETACAAHAVENSAPVARVTPHGDVVSAHGIIMGGGAEAHTGILLRKREIQTLSDTCDHLDARIAAVREAREQLERHLEDIRHQLQGVIAEKENAAQDALEAEKNRYQAETDLKTARRRLEVVSLEQEQLMGEEAELEETAEGHGRLLETISARVQAAQADTADNAARIRETRQQMEAFDTRIVELKLELRTASANRENAAATRTRLQGFQDDAMGRLDQIDADVAEKTKARLRDEERRCALEQKHATDQQALAELDQQVLADEETVSRFEAELSGHHSEAQKCRSRQAELQDQIRLLDVELAENRINRENLESRCQEYYQCAIADLPLPQPEKSKTMELFPETPDAVAEMEQKLADLRKKMAAIGDVNLEAIEAYEEQKTRHDFLCAQRDDLNKAIDGLNQVIREINKVTRDLFLDTFTKINEKLQDVFPQLFQGGSARLELTRPDNPLETGVEFMVSPPGKKLTRMSLLSGGEKALSAISFIFSVFLLKPASFCLMDEIDAPLDDANVLRFNNLMKTIGEKSQIIMITHNKNTMAFADTLFGITMEQKGLSKVVSVRLDRDENEERMAG